MKCKGVSVISGEYVYGDHYYYSGSHIYIQKKVNGIFSPENDIDVIPESISKFTGMHDCDGVEIYHKDILKTIDKGLINFMIYGDLSDVCYLNGTYIVTLLYDLTPLPLYEFETIYSNNNYKGPTETCTYLKDFKNVGTMFKNKNLIEND